MEEIYINKIIKETGRTMKEIRVLVERKKHEFKELISAKGALFILSKKLIIIEEILSTSLKSYLTSDKEKKIFLDNLTSLIDFEFFSNYKYSLIAMGSIIEFLLERYCKAKVITSEDYTAPNGSVIPATKKNFVNYVQSAIVNDIFGQKKRWDIVQNYLRDFRNYVHIKKEVNSENIDKSWYDTIRPVFSTLYEHFKRNSI